MLDSLRDELEGKQWQKQEEISEWQKVFKYFPTLILQTFKESF